MYIESIKNFEIGLQINPDAEKKYIKKGTKINIYYLRCITLKIRKFSRSSKEFWKCNKNKSESILNILLYWYIVLITQGEILS